MAYKSAAALEMAVKAAAKASPLDTNRAIAGFYHHRLLCRIFLEPDLPFVLKGGLGLLARTLDARYTRDIDLATSKLDPGEAMAELNRLAQRDLGDFVSFVPKGWRPIRANTKTNTGTGSPSHTMPIWESKKFKRCPSTWCRIRSSAPPPSLSILRTESRWPACKPCPTRSILPRGPSQTSFAAS